MSQLLEWLQQIKAALQTATIPLGQSAISVWSILYVILVLFFLFVLTGRLKNIVIRIVARRNPDVGVQHAIATIARYIFLTIGFAIVLQTAGIDMSAFTIVASALGVGAGFGLQNLTNNLVSGLVILFERPIKVGDRIQVGEIIGDVIRVSPRATTVSTNDNISVIVPNSEFVSSRVINWSHNDRRVRLHLPLGVSYSSDPERVRQLLLDVINSHPGVLATPKADVIFKDFGDSALLFEIRFWTSEYITRPFDIKSDLYFAVKKTFKENGIEIPFPQRDLHIRSGVLGIKQ